MIKLTPDLLRVGAAYSAKVKKEILIVEFVGFSEDNQCIVKNIADDTEHVVPFKALDFAARIDTTKPN